MGIFSTKYRYAFVLLLAAYSYANASFSEITRYYPIPATPPEIIIYFVLLTLLIWEGSRFMEGLLRRQAFGQQKPEKWAYGLATFFVLTTAYSAGLASASSYLLAVHFFHVPGENRMIIVKLSATLGTRINLFLQVINAIFFILGRLREKEREADMLRRVHAQAELQAIRNQVNPHFLFNNLNVLSALVLQERPEASRFIEAFATVYRHVLNAQQKELVALSEELTLLEEYLFLLHQRFPQSIDVLIDIDPVYKEYRIAPLALQMLIENAIKHNLATQESPLHLEVSTTATAQLVVVNNIQPRTTIEDSSRIGLLNIDQRYMLISGQHIDIHRTKDHFSVLLPLISPTK